MGLTNENVGPKILAKIKIYVLTRAGLLFKVCYEMPCWVLRVRKRFSQSKQNFLTIESDVETFIKAVAGSFRSANKEPMKTWDQVSRKLLNLAIDEDNEIL